MTRARGAPLTSPARRVDGRRRVAVSHGHGSQRPAVYGGRPRSIPRRREPLGAARRGTAVTPSPRAAQFKGDACVALGVSDVWLVDIRDQSVEVCRGRGEGETIRDVISWRPPTLDRIVPIALADVFAGIE
jgi:hypothetical protein